MMLPFPPLPPPMELVPRSEKVLVMTPQAKLAPNPPLFPCPGVDETAVTPPAPSPPQPNPCVEFGGKVSRSQGCHYYMQ